MAVVSFELKRESRSGKLTAQRRRYTNIYRAITNSKADGLGTIRSHAIGVEGLAYDSPHPDDADAGLVSIDVDEDGERGLTWLVTVEWDTGAGGSAIPDEDPLARPPEIRWGGLTESRPIFVDSEGTRIVNSAGERFDELPEREYGELTLSYTRNEASPNFMTLRTYMHVVNSQNFTIDGITVPVGVAKLHIEDIPKVVENGVTYYRVTYVFRFNAEEWEERILDLGYHQITDGPPTPEGEFPWAAIVDEDGMPVTKPWPLDGAGVAKSSPTAEPAELGPFLFYERKPFSVFAFT